MPPKNTLSDLQDHLMARIERLGDEDLKGDDLKQEINRSRTTAQVAGKMIDNARLVLDADKHLAEYDRERAGSALGGLLTSGAKNGDAD